MKRLLILMALCPLLAAAVWAQSPQSVVCNPDGTVTFKYKNDKAKQVQVDVQFAGRQPMTRQADGTWTATLGPVAKDMYPYCFVVDGVSIMDPENPLYFPNEGFKNSLLEIPGNGTLPHDICDVPHGSLEYVHYYSNAIGTTNNAVVYLPPGYHQDFQKKYPVFYLISGTTDTEETYSKVGRVNYILDNLLADGNAKEMIVVMPYGNPMKLKQQGAPTTVEGATTKERSDAPAAQMRFGGDPFSRDLIGDLMPYIEKNYRTINNADHRAIGGFSRGGNQALFNGLTNLDKFAYLCSYSSFTSTDIPNVYDNAAETNKKIRLFWLGVGTDDFLYGNARDYMEFLDSKGIKSVKELTHDKYGHTWMNAKYFLACTLPLLFNRKASSLAMQNAQPAPAKTGKEQQFTPGVMARLFPKPIVSPEYSPDSIVFRFKAPEAKEVVLACEILPDFLPMKKDADGVWTVTLGDYATETFKYCFLVDDVPVADPNNMLIHNVPGFKASIADNPYGPFSYAGMGNIAHGRVGYDMNRHEAWYVSPMAQPTMPQMVQLVPGAGDSAESWFTLGGAAAIADKLLADGAIKPVILTTSKLDFVPQGGAQPQIAPKVLRADDMPTWSQRRRALIRLLVGL